MKKLIATCVLLTAASMVSFAQTTTAPAPAAADPQAQHGNLPMSSEQMAERRAKMDEQQYTLTPEQYKKVYDVELEYTNAIGKFRTSHTQPAPGEIQTIRTKKDDAMKAILTDAQYTKYSAGRGPQRNATMMAPAAQPQQGK